MSYPTLEEVNKADHEQLCRWYRFLKSPGMSAIGQIGEDKWQVIFDAEVIILNRIIERFNEMGGFTPEISKQIGW